MPCSPGLVYQLNWRLYFDDLAVISFPFGGQNGNVSMTWLLFRSLLGVKMGTEFGFCAESRSLFGVKMGTKFGHHAKCRSRLRERVSNLLARLCKADHDNLPSTPTYTNQASTQSFGYPVDNGVG